MLEIIYQTFILLSQISFDIGRSVYYSIFDKPPKDVSEDVILITGAANGIGKELTKKFFKLKCKKLILVDYNMEQLESLKNELFSVEQSLMKRNDIRLYHLDLSMKKEDIYAVTDQIKNDIRPSYVTMLINNAGVVSGAPFLKLNDDAVERCMNVNVMSHFCSMAAIQGSSALADYSASKFAAFGFADAIAQELMKMNSLIANTIVCPYYINTGMFDGVQTKFPSILPISSTDYAVEKIFGGILRNEELIIFPFFCRLLYAFRGIFPITVERRLSKFLGINDCMNNFIGRKK
ncbi:hypothetical protein SNEBB_007160 [Seison nebaliae]|nr:hypothetical protein SNEBB_007160 [Seison nebaliae]